jgi:hypothetical protein
MTMGPKPKPAAERFWSKVEKTTKCWLWKGSINPVTGYGMFRGGDQRLVYAHRFAYEERHGAIPIGLQLDHKCRVRNCVRPGHLEAVPQAENIRRQWLVKKTCKHGHHFTPKNTYVRPSNGWRECRTCRRAKQAA